MIQRLFRERLFHAGQLLRIRHHHIRLFVRIARAGDDKAALPSRYFQCMELAAVADIERQGAFRFHGNLNSRRSVRALRRMQRYAVDIQIVVAHPKVFNPVGLGEMDVPIDGIVRAVKRYA